MQLALEFLHRQRQLLSRGSGRQQDAGADGSSQEAQDPAFAALVDFCHMLLNSNELIFVD